MYKMSQFESLSHQCDNDESNIMEMESLCLNCRENGITKLLPTVIPFYKQIVIMSFQCPHCEWSNNELQTAQTIDDMAIRYVVRCTNIKDLSRQIVKTEWAEIEIPEVEFEIKKQSSLITTIEGIIERAIDGLKGMRLANDDNNSETTGKFAEFIVKLKELKQGNKEFTFILNDISGNSFVENLNAPDNDPQLTVNRYKRSDDDDKLLGIYAPEDELNEKINEEVLQFRTNCSNCDSPCFTNANLTKIPHFKEVIIMATNCDACGHKTNEIKSGSGIEDKGMRITIKVNDESDLSRDVVKSDTCSIIIPELDIELSSSGNGRYTTVEGLGELIKEQFKSNQFLFGDSANPEIKQKITVLLTKLESLIGYTIILDDPCGNSYIQNAEDIVRYERTFEQNEELGLNDIKTENYE